MIRIVFFEIRYCQLFRPSAYVKGFFSQNLFHKNSGLRSTYDPFRGLYLWYTALPSISLSWIPEHYCFVGQQSRSAMLLSLHPIPALFTKTIHANIELLLDLRIIGECSGPAILIDYKYLCFPTEFSHIRH